VVGRWRAGCFHDEVALEEPASASEAGLKPGVSGPGDSAEDVAKASVGAKRLAALKRLRAATLAAKVPQASFHIDKEIAQLERGVTSQTALKFESANSARLPKQARILRTYTYVCPGESIDF
jgi:hypothetical protein